MGCCPTSLPEFTEVSHRGSMYARERGNATDGGSLLNV